MFAIHFPLADVSLEGFSISAGPLSPPFDETTSRYAVGPIRVPSTIFPAPAVTTTVTAKARDPGAIVTVAGKPTPSGTPSAPIALLPGSNPIDIAVTAPDRTTVTHVTVDVTGRPNDYVKTSPKALGSQAFGYSVALSGDTLAIGVTDGSQYNGDTSCATGVNPPPGADCFAPSGAVYVFVRSGSRWVQQAYIKASTTRVYTAFGVALALSGDTLVVGSPGERSKATGVNGDQTPDPVLDGQGGPLCVYAGCAYGAAYVFTRTGTTWAQTAYLKASNTRTESYFGGSVAVAGDTVVVGSSGESSGIAGNQADTSAPGAGAVYVFTRSGATYVQSAYLKAANLHKQAFFGSSLAISGDTLAVGAAWEPSLAIGIDDVARQSQFEPPDPKSFLTGSGAIYMFRRNGAAWTQEAFIKTPVHVASAELGGAVALDGDALVGGAPGQLDGGAVYVFTRGPTGWSAGDVLVPPNPQKTFLWFGRSVALSGNRLAVGMPLDASAAVGLGGDANDVSAPEAGGAYVYTKSGAAWSRAFFVKANNTRPRAQFARSVAISDRFFAVGAPYEGSGIPDDPTDLSALSAGAVYVY